MTSRRPQQHQVLVSHGNGILSSDKGRNAGAGGSGVATHRQKRKTSQLVADIPSSTGLLPTTATATAAAATTTGVPPRSGTHLTAEFFEMMSNVVQQPRDKSDVTAKRRKFQVHVPGKLMCILAMVFLIVPVLIFMHKEAHIHEDHDEAHFKTHKYIKVNTADAMSEFGKHVNAVNGVNDMSSGETTENNQMIVNPGTNNESQEGENDTDEENESSRSESETDSLLSKNEPKNESNQTMTSTTTVDTAQVSMDPELRHQQEQNEEGTSEKIEQGSDEMSINTPATGERLQTDLQDEVTTTTTGKNNGTSTVTIESIEENLKDESTPNNTTTRWIRR